ncbi:hypothetical protein PACTADRAFT_42855 [Pachysolen tannophilus NRRL Y-2460]|uniref:Peptidase M20 dimerisation domain-containing protein n=1 Tax=Pachysolen tannophilus NRRL Y-2460 TaxID=669874 RepID=A0A1E4TV23_PACTA|nr:hypothetical protein PACTADRAFT_42855 [Pachysolen tannophilus NRRL Y-2460]
MNNSGFNFVGTIGYDNPDSLCPVPDYFVPSSSFYKNDTIDLILHDENFRNNSVTKLSGSIQIPTEVYDEWGLIDENPEKWANFEKLHVYLEQTFPLFHKNLKKEKIYSGLIYTWEGSDSNLKPLLLMAHQDVVPVQIETIKDWTHEPFSGYYDGEFVWGRGTSDCKNLLIALMETIEELIKVDFAPKRTIILSFGADEESAGRSAFLLAKKLEERYGQNSMYAIIDEGTGFTESNGKIFAMPAVAEKGYLDAVISLTTPGGHSSIPPDHTSIGIVSELIQLAESNPFAPLLTNVNPILGFLQCVAEHCPSIDKSLKKNILKAHLDIDANQKVIEYLEKKSLASKYLITTSQAVDVIQGGAKSNALPEHVSVLINYRIAVESTYLEVAENVTGHLKQVADKYNLGIVREGEELLKPSGNGYFNFTYNDPLEAAPITPTNDKAWEVLSGTLRHFYEKMVYPTRFENDDYLIVAPAMSTGNTDTKSYWKLSDNIYRFTPESWKEYDSHAHSVDEKIDFESHLQIIAFFYEYILNVDGIKDEVNVVI